MAILLKMNCIWNTSHIKVPMASLKETEKKYLKFPMEI